jgi:hypothetical protein
MMKVQTRTWLKLVFVTAPSILLATFFLGSEYFTQLMPGLVKWRAIIFFIYFFCYHQANYWQRAGHDS